MHRVGARVWIARIMIKWGIISTTMMFVKGPTSFYVLRFLLGAAEAGFFPGMILYLTYWFPAHARGRAVARFMTATAIAGAIGNPISGLLLQMNGIGGLGGWQWLFLIEGIPSIVLAFVTFMVLPDGPAKAQWLTADEKRWLAERLEQDRAHSAVEHHHSPLAAMKSGRVWTFAAVYFTIVMSFYGITFGVGRTCTRGCRHLGNARSISRRGRTDHPGRADLLEVALHLINRRGFPLLEKEGTGARFNLAPKKDLAALSRTHV
jgi:ACS family tartrate transporter-like MFS transporter